MIGYPKSLQQELAPACVALAKIVHPPFVKIPHYFIIANVMPVTIEVRYIEFGHESCSAGYYSISDLF